MNENNSDDCTLCCDPRLLELHPNATWFVLLGESTRVDWVKLVGLTRNFDAAKVSLATVTQQHALLSWSNSIIFHSPGMVHRARAVGSGAHHRSPLRISSGPDIVQVPFHGWRHPAEPACCQAVSL